MDSTLLDQIRHLCRDRAAYEHLKAILVQQERVHQVSWEERYEQLISAQSAQSSDSPTSDILTNIIAREKALAQLADTIQRSPSLELVLQVAVQVAQKLLQVDRVAIFRCHEDGRGEFVTDAIAAGLTSLADMPERQLSLARHMLESTKTEHSTQTIDSIRSSTLSSHIVTLLEQIGISSYAANKIYAAQQIWGTLVAFHGSDYHIWAESDRTSLALIASQIGIAISLTNLRLQSQELSDDLQILQTELDKLQQTVIEIAEAKNSTALSNPSDTTSISELFLEPISDSSIQDVIKSEQINQDLEKEDLEPKELINESKGEFVAFENNLILQSNPTEIDLEKDENIKPSQNSLKLSIYNWLRFSFVRKNFGKKAIERNMLLPDIKDINTQKEKNQDIEENRITFNEQDISYVIMPDSLKLISVNNDEPEDIGLEGVGVPETNASDINTSDKFVCDISVSNLETNEPQFLAIVPNQIEASQAQFLEIEVLDIELPEQIETPSTIDIQPEPEINKSQAIALETIDIENEELGDAKDDLGSSLDEEPVMVIDQIEASQAQLPEIEVLDIELPEQIENPSTIETQPEPEINKSEAIALETIDIENEEMGDAKDDLGSSLDEEPVIVIDQIEASQAQLPEIEVLDIELPEQIENPSTIETQPEPEINKSGAIALETIDIENEEMGDAKDEEPVIEPQFIETILMVAGNDHKAIEFLLNVIDSYLEEAPRLVQEIDRAIAVNNHARLLISLNTLRSSSEYVGAVRLAYQCRQLESAVRENYVVLIYACLSRVAIELQQVTDALRIERSRQVANQ